MRKVYALLCLLCLAFILALVARAQSPGEKTRSGQSSAEFSSIGIPLRGADTQQIDWGQIAALMAVLGGISTAVQWILTRAIVQPQIAKAVADATNQSQLWAVTQFTSKGDFALHAQNDKSEHQKVMDLVVNLAEDQSRDAERLANLHDKVILLESRRTDR
jgi:hypothetical protein